MADFTPRIREGQKRLEHSADQAGLALAQRRKVLDDVKTIAAYAKEMRDPLNESELTERRTIIKSFVKEIVVMPGDTLLRYTVPMPDNRMLPGKAVEKVILSGSVLSTIHDGGAGGTRTPGLHSAIVALSQTELQPLALRQPGSPQIDLSKSYSHMELMGLEPMTSTMPLWRSPNLS